MIQQGLWPLQARNSRAVLMYRIALINMPFAAVHRPSLGLAQLKYATDSIFRERVSTEIHYFNHDFAEFLPA